MHARIHPSIHTSIRSRSHAVYAVLAGCAYASGCSAASCMLFMLYLLAALTPPAAPLPHAC
eukprot:355669-Chlamydomonas_euryale.AAC.3